MTTNEFLQEVNDALRATEAEAPTIGTDEADYWLRTSNRLRRNLYKKSKIQFRSTYEVLELGTVSASTEPSFDLDDTFISEAAQCYVITENDDRIDYDVLKPQERDNSYQHAFVAGQDPAVLYFSAEFTATDSAIDGTLYLPSYVMPDPISLTSGSATIVVDDPDWLVIATAAEIAFGDITYEDKVGKLNSQANDLYTQMVENNQRGTFGNQRSSKQKPRIRIGRGGR